jgi:glycosyltransferase involved in cell wall biosynthesis
MMVKNREASVGVALESAASLVDGYSIIDTGSTDGTVPICERYGRVRHIEWTHDYGRHRTDVLRACESDGADWCLMLDSDEEIATRGDYRQAMAVAAARDFDAMLIDCVPVSEQGFHKPDPLFRLIRLNRGLRWIYPNDEQLIGYRQSRCGYTTLKIHQDYAGDPAPRHAIRLRGLAPLRANSEAGSAPWMHATCFLARSYCSIGDYTTAEVLARDLIVWAPDRTDYVELLDRVLAERSQKA